MNLLSWKYLGSRNRSFPFGSTPRKGKQSLLLLTYIIKFTVVGILSKDIVPSGVVQHLLKRPDYCKHESINIYRRGNIVVRKCHRPAWYTVHGKGVPSTYTLDVNFCYVTGECYAPYTLNL